MASAVPLRRVGKLAKKAKKAKKAEKASSLALFRPWREAAIDADSKPMTAGLTRSSTARRPPRLTTTAVTSPEGHHHEPSTPSWPVPARSNSFRKRISLVYLQKVGESAASAKAYAGQLQARKVLGCSTSKLTELSRTEVKCGVIKGHNVSFWRPNCTPMPVLDPDGFAYEDAQPDHHTQAPPYPAAPDAPADDSTADPTTDLATPCITGPAAAVPATPTSAAVATTAGPIKPALPAVDESYTDGSCTAPFLWSTPSPLTKLI